jgi:hypothetical protein
MPSTAVQWIDGVLLDPAFQEMTEARHALTHRRLIRHFHAAMGSGGPDNRLELSIGTRQVPVPQLVDEARRVATHHVSDLLALLPQL